MSFSPAILYDILFLIVFSFAAVKSWQKGFLAGLAELIGAVLGVGIAVWGSRTLAPEIYQRFFSDAIANKVDQAVAQSGGDMAAAVQGLDFLPESLRTAVAAGLQTAGGQLPEKSPHCWSRFSCRWCRSFCSCCSASWYGGCSPSWYVCCAASTACRR